MQKLFVIIFSILLSNLLVVFGSDAKPTNLSEYKYKMLDENIETDECESYEEGLLSKKPDNSKCRVIRKGSRACYVASTCECVDGFIPFGENNVCTRYDCSGYDYKFGLNADGSVKCPAGATCTACPMDNTRHAFTCKTNEGWVISGEKCECDTSKGYIRSNNTCVCNDALGWKAGTGGCVAKECPSGQSTTTNTCNPGYQLTYGDYSGGVLCAYCDKETCVRGDIYDAAKGEGNILLCSSKGEPLATKRDWVEDGWKIKAYQLLSDEHICYECDCKIDANKKLYDGNRNNLYSGQPYDFQTCPNDGVCEPGCNELYYFRTCNPGYTKNSAGNACVCDTQNCYAQRTDKKVPDASAITGSNICLKPTACNTGYKVSCDKCVCDTENKFLISKCDDHGDCTGSNVCWRIDTCDLGYKIASDYKSCVCNVGSYYLLSSEDVPYGSTSGSGNCWKIDSCTSPRVISNDKRSCVCAGDYPLTSCPDHWATCPEHTATDCYRLDACKTGYYISNNKCLCDTTNYPLTTDYAAHATEYSGSDQCWKVTACTTGYAVNSDASGCTCTLPLSSQNATNVASGGYYGSTDCWKVTACTTGYAVNSDASGCTCTYSRTDKNAANACGYEGSGNCWRVSCCNDGYVTNTDKSGCTCTLPLSSKSDTNASEYTGSGSCWKITKCNDGYEPNSNGSACVCKSGYGTCPAGYSCTGSGSCWKSTGSCLSTHPCSLGAGNATGSSRCWTEPTSCDPQFEPNGCLCKQCDAAYSYSSCPAGYNCEWCGGYAKPTTCKSGYGCTSCPTYGTCGGSSSCRTSPTSCGSYRTASGCSCNCSTTYPLTACPEGGNCSGGDGCKKLDSCKTCYTQSGNSCSYTCPSTHPTRGSSRNTTYYTYEQNSTCTDCYKQTGCAAPYNACSSKITSNGSNSGTGGCWTAPTCNQCYSASGCSCVYTCPSSHPTRGSSRNTTYYTYEQNSTCTDCYKQTGCAAPYNACSAKVTSNGSNSGTGNCWTAPTCNSGYTASSCSCVCAAGYGTANGGCASQVTANGSNSGSGSCWSAPTCNSGYTRSGCSCVKQQSCGSEYKYSEKCEAWEKCSECGGKWKYEGCDWSSLNDECAYVSGDRCYTIFQDQFCEKWCSESCWANAENNDACQGSASGCEFQSRAACSCLGY